MEVLNVSLTVDESKVAECAVALHQRLRPSQFRILAALAAEIVARHETAAAGTTVLVLPVSALDSEVVRAVQRAGLPLRE